MALHCQLIELDMLPVWAGVSARCGGRARSVGSGDCFDLVLLVLRAVILLGYLGGVLCSLLHKSCSYCHVYYPLPVFLFLLVACPAGARVRAVLYRRQPMPQPFVSM